MNSEIEAERVQAEHEWRENYNIYHNEYIKTLERLPKSFLTFYNSNYGFHDYHPKNIEIINNVYGTGIRGKIDSIGLKIIISDNDNSWELSYSGISKIVIEYIASTDVIETKKGFNDLGYNELLIVDDKIISHEILFASGSTILIHFSKISLKKLK